MCPFLVQVAPQFCFYEVHLWTRKRRQFLDTKTCPFFGTGDILLVQAAPPALSTAANGESRASQVARGMPRGRGTKTPAVLIATTAAVPMITPLRHSEPIHVSRMRITLKRVRHGATPPSEPMRWYAE